MRTGSHLGTIGINGAQDSWILGVGITGTQSAATGIVAWDSRNMPIKDSSIDRIVGGGGGQFTSYGMALVQLSHSLIENNILNRVESPSCSMPDPPGRSSPTTTRISTRGKAASNSTRRGQP